MIERGVSMSNQGVYKTQVTCEIGFSVCVNGTDWEKSRVCIASDVGPGYPEPDLMAQVCKRQMADATSACSEQIDFIANKVIQQANARVPQ